MEIRKPSVDDAEAMWDIVRRTDSLDTNSRYHYLLLCHDFSDTSVVACDHGELIGFITGYRRPDSQADLFAWQTAVDPAVNAPGLATLMLTTLVDRMVPLGVRHLETTISPHNRAVRMMLRRFAAERDVEIETSVLFDEDAFPDGHDAEILYRVGPLR
ncbi:diaminobutyrate acetyltransferase [Actinokineospora sp. UTMC 2448]|uniref:diaminobutyrate acetyltransferase n=1 Tax=Actinokineospora sp. UTMC 2448 TaxID=2268449 RepID=UPI002164E49B|nr:diaminobutyrate acetyltransferase [Actinokineospora sp. UTMC 2448]UVS79488.1 L-2,4-diaminobutyric acid acetyltransferase [Actinokineospora sp. UTMC 2448]